MNNKEFQAETEAQQNENAELLPSALLLQNCLLTAVFVWVQKQKIYNCKQ